MKKDKSLGDVWVDKALAAAMDEREASGELDCLAILNEPLLPTETGHSIAREPRTDAWHQPFLMALARHGWIGGACRMARISRSVVYAELESNPVFAAAAERARQEYTELLEAVAYERAINGSDRLLEFLLKGAQPSKYRENNGAVVNVNSGPIIVDVVTDAMDMVAPANALPDTSFSMVNTLFDTSEELA